MRIGSPRSRFGFLTASAVSIGIASAMVATGWSPANSATITASYESGYLDVSINGYGTPGMGTFRLDDAGAGHVALCVEADQGHSTDDDAYSPVDNQVHSPELDALIWLISQMPSIDSDTGIAAASLAWYYADAARTIGVPVWADGHHGFAPISPVDPQRWDALSPYSMSYLIGLRSEDVDLDAAERRVVELFDAVASLVGPWHLTDLDGRFRLTGAAGPIAGQVVRVEVRDHTGSPVSSTDLITDAEGWITPAVPAMPAGGSVHAEAPSPGIHREWDGEGEVQRLVTSTDAMLSVERRVPAQPGELLVIKASSDPTLGVGGAVFSVRDARHVEIERVASAADGSARFAPIDPAVHPAPYTVVEVSAPAGLLVSAPDQTVHSLSPNPSAPTTVIMTDAPRTIPIHVLKQISVAGVGPTDRSGFEFDLVRRADGLSTRLITDAAGHSQAVEVALGEYTVCEVAVPSWATSLVDGGCVQTAITLDAIDAYDEAIALDPGHRPAFEVRYVNHVAEPTIKTQAHDPADGDRSIDAGGGTAIDVVTMTGLVPGTTYRIAGELVPPGEVPTSIAIGDEPEGVPTGSTGSPRVAASLEFTAADTTETHELEFSLPALAAGKYVIVERLWVGDVLLAEHADLTDELQTIDVQAAPTTTTTSTTTTTTTSTVPATTTVPATSTIPATTVAATIPATPEPTPTTFTTPPATPPTLPRTGGNASGIMHAADMLLVAGLSLIAITRLVPRRDRPV